jgi:hypothetical protein
VTWFDDEARTFVLSHGPGRNPSTIDAKRLAPPARANILSIDQYAEVQRGAGRTFQHAAKRKPLTDYERAQEAFWKNYERLKAERLARDVRG